MDRRLRGRRTLIKSFKARWIAALAILGVHGVQATNYSFTKIADDSDGTFTEFTIGSSLNDLGTVAFTATGPGGTRGLYTGSGGSVQTVFQGSASSYSAYGPVINNRGDVSYLLAHIGPDPYSEVVYSSGGSSTTVVAGNAGNVGNVNPPWLNNQGVVAYGAGVAASPSNPGGFALYTWDGGTSTERYFASTNGPFIGLSTFVRMNDSGALTFNGTLGPMDHQVNGIFKGSGGTYTTVAVENGAGGFSFLSPMPALNNAGVVVFQATSSSGKTGLYSGNGGSLTTYVDTDGPYNSIYGFVSISDGGVVAFRATTDNQLTYGTEGIFTGADPLTDHVIRIGDELFPGFFVTDFFYDNAINAHGQIVFRYTVRSLDGQTTRKGIALATPDSSAPVLNNAFEQQVTVGGGPTVVGGLSATFDAVTNGGRFSADYFQAVSGQGLAIRIGDAAANAVDFNFAGATSQVWQVEFSGAFTGSTTLVFHYDDTGLLVPEDSLQIRHFVNGAWETPSQSLNTVSNTITLSANSFSPFILASPVPEPSVLGMILFGAASLVALRQSRLS